MEKSAHSYYSLDPEPGRGDEMEKVQADVTIEAPLYTVYYTKVKSQLIQHYGL